MDNGSLYKIDLTIFSIKTQRPNNQIENVFLKTKIDKIKEQNKNSQLYNKYVLFEVISEKILLFYYPERKTLCVIDIQNNKTQNYWHSIQQLKEIPYPSNVFVDNRNIKKTADDQLQNYNKDITNTWLVDYKLGCCQTFEYYIDQRMFKLRDSQQQQQVQDKYYYYKQLFPYELVPQYIFDQNQDIIACCKNFYQRSTTRNSEKQHFIIYTMNFTQPQQNEFVYKRNYPQDKSLIQNNDVDFEQNNIFIHNGKNIVAADIVPFVADIISINAAGNIIAMASSQSNVCAVFTFIEGKLNQLQNYQHRKQQPLNNVFIVDNKQVCLCDINGDITIYDIPMKNVSIVSQRCQKQFLTLEIGGTNKGSGQRSTQVTFDDNVQYQVQSHANTQLTDYSTHLSTYSQQQEPQQPQKCQTIEELINFIEQKFQNQDSKECMDILINTGKVYLQCQILMQYAKLISTKSSQGDYQYLPQELIKQQLSILQKYAILIAQNTYSYTNYKIIDNQYLFILIQLQKIIDENNYFLNIDMTKIINKISSVIYQQQQEQIQINKQLQDLIYDQKFIEQITAQYLLDQMQQYSQEKSLEDIVSVIYQSIYDKIDNIVQIRDSCLYLLDNNFTERQRKDQLLQQSQLKLKSQIISYQDNILEMDKYKDELDKQIIAQTQYNAQNNTQQTIQRTQIQQQIKQNQTDILNSQIIEQQDKKNDDELDQLTQSKLINYIDPEFEKQDKPEEIKKVDIDYGYEQSNQQLQNILNNNFGTLQQQYNDLQQQLAQQQIEQNQDNLEQELQETEKIQSEEIYQKEEQLEEKQENEQHEKIEENIEQQIKQQEQIEDNNQQLEEQKQQQNIEQQIEEQAIQDNNEKQQQEQNQIDESQLQLSHYNEQIQQLQQQNIQIELRQQEMENQRLQLQSDSSQNTNSNQNYTPPISRSIRSSKLAQTDSLLQQSQKIEEQIVRSLANSNRKYSILESFLQQSKYITPQNAQLMQELMNSSQKDQYLIRIKELLDEYEKIKKYMTQLANDEEQTFTNALQFLKLSN